MCVKIFTLRSRDLLIQLIERLSNARLAVAVSLASSVPTIRGKKYRKIKSSTFFSPTQTRLAWSARFTHRHFSVTLTHKRRGNAQAAQCTGTSGVSFVWFETTKCTDFCSNTRSPNYSPLGAHLVLGRHSAGLINFPGCDAATIFFVLGDGVVSQHTQNLLSAQSLSLIFRFTSTTKFAF